MGPTQLPVEPPPARYGATALGAFAGGLGGGAAGLLSSRMVTEGPDDAAGSAFLVLGIVFVLLWAGVVAGVWVILRRMRDRVALRTTLMVAAGVPAWSVISVPSVFWSLEYVPADRLGALGLGALVVVMLTVPPALGARWIILVNEKLPEREENSA